MDAHNITSIIVSLFTLTLLEIILGVDNLIFIAIASNRLAPEKQKMARRFGLLLALVSRLALLASVFWIAHLEVSVFTIFNQNFSARDLILLGGGLFLLYKATLQIHEEAEPHGEKKLKHRYDSVPAVIMQIGVLDIIFSIDSVFTAVGMTPHFWVMATAIIITIMVMIFASEPLSHFIESRPTIRILALSFILLIGTLLVADGLQFHFPRNFVYFSICFALFIELLNNWVQHRKSI